MHDVDCVFFLHFLIVGRDICNKDDASCIVEEGGPGMSKTKVTANVDEAGVRGYEVPERIGEELDACSIKLGSGCADVEYIFLGWCVLWMRYSVEVI